MLQNKTDMFVFPPLPMLLFRMCNHRNDADAGWPRRAGNGKHTMAEVIHLLRPVSVLSFVLWAISSTADVAVGYFKSVRVASSSYYMQVSGILALICCRYMFRCLCDKLLTKLTARSIV